MSASLRLLASHLLDEALGVFATDEDVYLVTEEEPPPSETTLCSLAKV